ncbi:hypothetical protein CHO01_22740 [Cellulomonas hominis]|uniref:Uncharacterized protein n=1 Tax=Cellulomonas hominis TaxID=156981 RepID=A0A511FH35_9CELL|nr:hypothetical protein [Cellulomonas hominis]MBB5474604.1 hypothetical protein [Cellulomonas hominis]NKY05477.1 hypothetical protein [Cellulomonas hominis]GEL47158.1 hypothetical protein CHO01_22740 [Cellulomonas hominis]
MVGLAVGIYALAHHLSSPTGPVPSFGAPEQLVVPTAAPSRETHAPSTSQLPQAGDVLEEDPGVLPGGLAAIELDDHAWHVLDSSEPLPDVVVQSIAARAVEAADSADPGASALAREEIDAWVYQYLGLHPVLVIPVETYTAAGTSEAWSFWVRDEVMAYMEAPAGKAETVAAAQDWISRHPRSAEFTLVEPR